MAAPLLLLVNPSAGGGRAGRLLPDVEAALRRHGLRARTELTRDLPHARELALAAALGGETVVCLSGDGMVGAVADGLREVPDSVLGVLPGGRGNDLARVLGLGQDPVTACAVIAAGHTHKLDLGVVDGKAFVGIASVGFDSEANRIANQAPRRLGNLVYLYGALGALARWRPVRFEIELDPPGERHSFTGYTVGACNSTSYGGGMRAAPKALLDDGLLDVLMLEDVSKLRFLGRILPKVFRGTHTQEPTVKAFRAHEVAISADRPLTLYADGDPIAQLPARVKVLPAAVSVLVPADSGGSAPPFVDATHSGQAAAPR
jgi:YegS/Rv2252/BmrU family lipid kinase